MLCTLASLPLARGLAARQALALPLSAVRSSAVAAAGPAAQQQQRAVAAAAGGGDDGARQIAPPDVRELARMAHIDITDEEVADWGPKIEAIVDWFGQLQAVDVEGVPPALRADTDGDADAHSMPLRADEPRRYAEQAAMLEQVPDREGAFVRVPKIATAADD